MAVGDHILLGGDNMDLALAHAAEAQITGGPDNRLGAGRFTQLLLQCRHSKERLLGPNPPASARVTVLGSGSKLIGGALSAVPAGVPVMTRSPAARSWNLLRDSSA